MRLAPVAVLPAVRAFFLVPMSFCPRMRQTGTFAPGGSPRRAWRAQDRVRGLVFALMIVIKNAFWLSVCRFAADFSSLVLFTFISRDLGPASTGEYSYAFALGAFIAIFAASGLDQYGVRQYMRLTSDEERATCWRSMLAAQGLQLVMGLGLLGLAIAYLGGRNANPLVIVELTVFLVGWGLSRTFFIPASARQAMAIPAFIELGCRAFAALLSLVLLLAGVHSMPLILLGTAAYPVLSRAALQDRDGFLKLSEEFLRSVLFVSGWLAVGMYCLVPLVIDFLFGDRFDPAARMLPLFSVLAVVKGLEIAVYRLLYATRRQNTYLAALVFGTILIVSLNFWLIPAFGANGAIAVVVLSSALVNLICITGLKKELPGSVFLFSLGRLVLPLACTALVLEGLHSLGLNGWIAAIGACLAFPVLGIASGLLPHPRRSLLLATERAPTPT
jgi:O-antigen/teichoic acid export membrane protein